MFTLFTRSPGWLSLPLRSSSWNIDWGRSVKRFGLLEPLLYRMHSPNCSPVFKRAHSWITFEPSDPALCEAQVCTAVPASVAAMGLFCLVKRLALTNLHYHCAASLEDSCCLQPFHEIGCSLVQKRTYNLSSIFYLQNYCCVGLPG